MTAQPQSAGRTRTAQPKPAETAPTEPTTPTATAPAATAGARTTNPRPTTPRPTATRIAAGTTLDPLTLETMRGTSVSIPDSGAIVHLQFRRYAGCPACNLHLQAFARRQDELAEAGVHEVLLFHSTNEELLEYEALLPFDVVGDPQKELYTRFGVETMRSKRAFLSPAIFRLTTHLVAGLMTRERRMPPAAPTGGVDGLPADLLIASDGRVLAVKYGDTPYDQWTVNEVLELVAQAGGELAVTSSAS